MKDGKHVILVIDDDQDILDAARAVLESGGYAMVEAPSAHEGKDIFNKEKPDLLIVDIMMEQILTNIHTTPIGQVLRKIASLPEVRREKVLDVRRQLTEGQYNLDERLDVALDKVLEYLTT